MNLKLYIIIILFISPTIAASESIYIGRFKPYWYGDSLYIKPISSTKENVPLCAKRDLLRLPNEPSSEVFKAKYSMLLALWMSQQKIKIIGSNQCTNEGDEIIRAIDFP